MTSFKSILDAIGSFISQAWSLPQSMANNASEKQRRLALKEQEAERLDRIRNPSKYLGKQF